MRQISIREFDIATASRQELQAAHALLVQLEAEAWPEDPPRSLEDWERSIRSVPPFWAVHRWVARQEGRTVASANVYMFDTEHNRHIADGYIGVDPASRRQGIARKLLARIVAKAAGEGRTLLVAGTDSAIPAGGMFMNRIGARVGIVSRTNQLDLAHLDRSLMKRWCDEGPRDLFTLGWWIGPYPEEYLAPICELKAVMNTAPRDDLQMDDWTWTPEMLRQGERSLTERRTERWALYARHQASGDLAGYTEVFWEKSRPTTLWQGDTGVLPAYRGHGLGKWLKATMVEKVRAERPQVVRVRTGNANSNAPMLRINDAMGFRPYKDWTTWQIELGPVRDYLDNR